jgi:hypothetical protein
MTTGMPPESQSLDPAFSALDEQRAGISGGVGCELGQVLLR